MFTERCVEHFPSLGAKISGGWKISSEKNMKPFYERYWVGLREVGALDHVFKLPVLEQLLPRDTKGSILDFGCGNGEVLRAVRNLNPRAKLTGVDISSEAIRQAKTKIGDVRYYKVPDGKNLPLTSSSIDFILSFDVIEHVYDTELAFSEFSRVLKPGGKILISTPYHGFIKNIIIAAFLFDTIYDPLGPHIRFFTKKSLCACLSRVGLVPLKVGYFGRFFPINNAMYVLAMKEK